MYLTIFLWCVLLTSHSDKMKILLILSGIVAVSYGFVCPPDFCDSVKCEPSNCGPRETLMEKSSVCGCCDICVKELEVGENCTTPLLGAPPRGGCYGNTYCHPTTRVCSYKCIEERARMQKLSQNNLGVSVPDCDEDGSYSTLRCRGSQCMCLRKDGSPTGHTMNKWETRGATCRCARDQAEYLRTRLIGSTFHCTENGNYSPVQCRGSQCFCADEFGKQINGTLTVHITQTDGINC